LQFIKLSVFSVFLALWANCSVANPTLKSLFSIETRGLNSISIGRFEELLTLPQAPGSGAPFTQAWLDTLGKPKGSAEMECLAEALYFEARGESIKGQFAVAEVIINRVKSTRFPKSICGVIRQGTGRKYQCQFTYTCDGLAERISEPRAYRRSQQIAQASLDGVVQNLTNGATHYHTTAVRPRWSKVYSKTVKIGRHIFYRHTYRTASN
jgi:hypothetical protein